VAPWVRRPERRGRGLSRGERYPVSQAGRSGQTATRIKPLRVPYRCSCRYRLPYKGGEMSPGCVCVPWLTSQDTVGFRNAAKSGPKPQDR
jgi:hypothetical protein